MKKFNVGDGIESVIGAADITRLRCSYGKDSYGVAIDAYNLLMRCDVESCVVTFINVGVAGKPGVVIRDDINGRYVSGAYHSVLLLDDCVLDILYSDVLLSVSDYVGKMRHNTPMLHIDAVRSGSWYCINGVEYQLSVSSLINLRI